MKNISKIILTLSLITFIACSGYGEKLQYKKTEVYYTNKVKKVDAEKLGEFLVSSEFAGENEKSIQLTKDEKTNHYVFRMVTTKEASENKTYETIFKLYAKQISDSVFNKEPVDFHICNNTFKTIKIIPFKKNETN